jgi:uncharacterized protein (DUF302 family)
MTTHPVYAAETAKGVDQFARDLATVAEKFGFVIHNETTMDMAHTFGNHGVEVAEGFDLHMLQICKPEKAAQSLGINPERAILMPKYVITFTQEGRTQIRFLRLPEEFIQAAVDDAQFPRSLSETYRKIEEMIEEAR